MNRSEAATYVGDRYGEYLTAVARAASDGAGKTLKSAIDDALRALRYTEAELPTVVTAANSIEEADFRVQVLYRAMNQITRDLGTTFNLSSALGSLSLYQMRQSAEKDLAEAKAVVMERFGTTDLVPEDTEGVFVTLDLNFLEPSIAEMYG